MSEKLPWEGYDQFFFGRNGIAPFKRNTHEYDDFITFMARYRIAKQTQNLNKDYLHEGLKLFIMYQQKKQLSMAEKITKDRMELPVYKHKQKIIDAVSNNRVVLIAADTGAGKSTQIPQYLMEAGFNSIACTQPRRIACYSLAKRVSYESLNRYGSEIAHQVRFDVSKTDKTRVLFLTEGVLLRQFASDPFLKQYNIIIIDEVHERHITGDFLLGILKRILDYRLDLKLVLMSATINAELFGKYFKAPIIEIPGRMFPVSIEYYPVQDEDTNLTDQQFIDERKNQEIINSIPSKGARIKAAAYLKILERIDKLIPSTERGDLLIFVFGMNEIGILAEELKQYAAFSRRWIILELHSSLSVQQQEKVFDISPEGVRKCIISTNIAETSVTIDGIRFLIDSGKVKEMGHDSIVGISRLSEFWISKSSAKQRAGRCGRTGEGQCFRFYSKKEHDAFNEFPVPEIMRMPLTSIILEIKVFGLGDPRVFDFIERPAESSISSAISKLSVLGCIDQYEEITDLGKILAKMPVDQVLGKMLILGSISQLISPIVAIAAVLSIQSPYTRDSNSRLAEKRRELFSDHGDPFTLMNTFLQWLEEKSNSTQSSRKWCKSLGIEEQRMYEIVKLKTQFEKILINCTTENIAANSFENLEEATISDEERKYKKRDQKLVLEKRKRETRTTKRKFLKFTEGSDIESPDDQRETINELEFKISHDAEDLLNQTDVNMLSHKDLTVIKLIMCSGLYPNIAIPDEANYARPASEQTFHTKAKRFLCMIPNSVFAFKPELLQGESPQSVHQDSHSRTTLDNLHGKRTQKDLLTYVSLLETTKPYMLNSTRISALSVALLFSQKLDISFDLKHLVMDEWLEIEFEDRTSALQVLELGCWLRYAWEKIVNLKLKMFSVDSQQLDSHKKERINYKDCIDPFPLGDLDYIPQVIISIRKKWYDLEYEGGLKNMSDEDIIGILHLNLDGLVKLVDLNVEFSVRKLKNSKIETMFGYNPFNSTIAGDLTVRVTPHINFYISQSDFIHRDKNYFHIPVPKKKNVKKVTESQESVKVRVPESRSRVECPVCLKILLLTESEMAKHELSCK